MRSVRHNLLFALGILVLISAQVVGQDDRSRDRGRDRDRDRDESSERGSVREGGIPREQVESPRERREEATEEGMPALRSDRDDRMQRDSRIQLDDRRVAPLVVPDDRSRWKLGVYAYNTPTGVVLTRVVPRSAAWDAGLEEGDRIVTVNGFQVGWVSERLYPLGAELQRQAGRRGDVTLLVQNVRNGQLLVRDVRLDDVGYGRSPRN